MTEWKKVTDAMLFRFFAEQTTLEETDMISAWLNEDPEKNQKVLDKAYNLYVLGIMCAPNPEAGINNSRSFLRFGWPKVLRYAGVAAAILLLGIAVDHVLLSQRMNRWLQQQTTVEVPAGQHIRLTLGMAPSWNLMRRAASFILRFSQKGAACPVEWRGHIQCRP